MKVPEADEISAYMAEKVKANPSRINNLIDEALRQIIEPNFGGYGADFVPAAGSWLDPSAIRRLTSSEIAKCREMLIRGEAHHQLSSHFVQLMIEEEIPLFGRLPDRIGDQPAHRAAASFTTMMCNHELYLIQLLEGLEPAPTFNRGIPMAQRYYVATNNAIPFMRYQAKVMSGLALWSIAKEVRGGRTSYFIKPGPCLDRFMVSYFKAVEWATNIVTEALEDEP